MAVLKNAKKLSVSVKSFLDTIDKLNEVSKSEQEERVKRYKEQNKEEFNSYVEAYEKLKIAIQDFDDSLLDFIESSIK